MQRSCFAPSAILLVLLTLTTCDQATTPTIGAAYRLQSVGSARLPVRFGAGAAQDTTFVVVAGEQIVFDSDTSLRYFEWWQQAHVSPAAETTYTFWYCSTNEPWLIRHQHDTLIPYWPYPGRTTFGPLFLVPHGNALHSRRTVFWGDSALRYVLAAPRAAIC
jgi:hypothetical protein